MCMKVTDVCLLCLGVISQFQNLGDKTLLNKCKWFFAFTRVWFYLNMLTHNRISRLNWFHCIHCHWYTEILDKYACNVVKYLCPQRKMTLLEDNHPCAMYNYLVNVQTGHRRGAGTTAKVIYTHCVYVLVFTCRCFSTLICLEGAFIQVFVFVRLWWPSNSKRGKVNITVCLTLRSQCLREEGWMCSCSVCPSLLENCRALTYHMITQVEALTGRCLLVPAFACFFVFLHSKAETKHTLKWGEYFVLFTIPFVILTIKFTNIYINKTQ